MKRSNTPGAKPVSLGYAEVAVNVADGIFFYGGYDGAVHSFPLSVAGVLANAALTGTPTAPDPAVNDNSEQVANTKFVQALLASTAPLVSPALTGTPTAPNPPPGSATAQLATAAFVAGGLATNATFIGAKALTYYPGTTPTAKLQAWAASGDRRVYIDQDFLLTATVVLPAYGQIFGNGHVITKGFNGDMFDMSGQACGIHNLLITGGRYAGGYTGRGIVIGGSGAQNTTTSEQRLHNVDISDMDGYCLEFTAAGAGGQFIWQGGSASRYMVKDSNGHILTSQLTLAAIKLPGNGVFGDASNDPQTYGLRRFLFLDASGTCLIDFAGANITDMLYCTAFQSLYRPGTRYAKWTGGRHVESPVLYGIGNFFDGVTIDGGNGPFTLGAGCQECIVRLGTNGVTWVDASGNTSNQIWDNVPRPFTPTFAPIVQGPPGFVLGNGTLTGSIMRRGGQVDVKMRLTVGSTTTFGTDGGWGFQLPAPYNNIFPQSADAIGVARTNAGGTFYSGAAVLAAGSATVTIFPDNGGANIWGNKVPAAIAAGQFVEFSLTFDID